MGADEGRHRPEAEPQRLLALRGYGVLDTPREVAFDDITSLAATICQTPIALISLIDADRQWFKSVVGLTVTETPRDISFCAHAIRDHELLIVPDALADERFNTNPLVTAAPGIRFYAGAPLITAEGFALGALCVADHRPRELAPAQQEALRALSRQTMAQLELRRSLADAGDESLEQRRSLAALVEIARRLTRGLDLGTVLGSIAEAAALLFKGDAGFRLVEGEFLVRVAATTGALGAMARERVRLGETFSGHVALTGEAVRTENTAADPRRLAEHQAALNPGRAGALMCVPLRLGDRILGTLNVYRERGHRFDDEALRLATSFADQAAIALENARLYAEGVRRRREAEELARVSRALTESLDVEAVGERIVESVVPLFGSVSSGLLLAQPDGSLKAVGWGGLARGVFEVGQVFDPGTLFVGRALTSGAPAWTPDVLGEAGIVMPDDVRRRIIAIGLHGILAVPMRAKDRTIGVLSIADGAVRAFSDAEVSLLQTFADQAALALENARLYAETERRRREAEELARIARLLTESLDVAAVGDRIVESVLTLFSIQSAVLRLRQPDGSLLTVSVGGREREHFEPGHVLPAGVGVVGRAAAEGRPISRDVEDETGVTLTDAVRRRLAAAGLSTLLAVPLRAKSEVLGVLSVGREERRHFSSAEVDLLQAFADQAAVALENARLYRRVQDAYTQLAQTQDHLVRGETLRAVGELAAGAAHHLNNLLAIIVGRLELAVRKSEPSEIHRHLLPAQRAAQDSAEVVRRLGSFSRSQREPAFVPVDLNQVAQDIREMTRPRWQDEAELRGIHIEVTLEPGSIPPVAGDPSSLREVLVNLVLNAVDALPRGGSITIRTWLSGTRVHCSVGDTGIGMAVDVQRRALEPFFTTKGLRSTGLGLSVNYGIVQRHGGDLTIESVEGHGTTVSFWLPGALSPEPPPSAPGLEGASPPLRILLIEDEEEVRRVIAEMLAEDGHHVVEAADGVDGLNRLAGASAIDLVLTDLGMPGMTGWDVGRAVRAASPSLPVGLITGWGEDPERTHADESAIDFILAKPVTRQALRMAIARARVGRVTG